MLIYIFFSQHVYIYIGFTIDYPLLTNPFITFDQESLYGVIHRTYKGMVRGCLNRLIHPALYRRHKDRLLITFLFRH